ncbi:MAG: isoprenoid biosynthesis protein [Methylophaga sp.]|nr:MAG: isoprenoid biosynthesis protein [Methylophaga sp.]
MKNRIFTVFFLLCMPQWLFAQDIPDFSANYRVKLNGMSAGELKRNLSTNDDGSRTFSSQSQAKGLFAFFKPDLIEETSIWKTEGKGIRPQSYLYQRSGGKKDKYLSLTFDWQNQKIKMDDNKHVLSLQSKANTLDKLSYQLALMLDLAQEKKTFSYHIADGNKFKTYDIILLGTEIINTPLGKIETVKLTRQRGSKKQRKTTLWCAPSLHYLPVKIEHIEKDGTNFTAELRRLKGIDSSAAFEKKVAIINTDPLH